MTRQVALSACLFYFYNILRQNDKTFSKQQRDISIKAIKRKKHSHHSLWSQGSSQDLESRADIPIRTHERRSKIFAQNLDAGFCCEVWYRGLGLQFTATKPQKHNDHSSLYTYIYIDYTHLHETTATEIFIMCIRFRIHWRH